MRVRDIADPNRLLALGIPRQCQHGDTGIFGFG